MVPAPAIFKTRANARSSLPCLCAARDTLGWSDPRSLGSPIFGSGTPEKFRSLPSLQSGCHVSRDLVVDRFRHLKPHDARVPARIGRKMRWRCLMLRCRLAGRGHDVFYLTSSQNFGGALVGRHRTPNRTTAKVSAIGPCLATNCAAQNFGASTGAKRPSTSEKWLTRGAKAPAATTSAASPSRLAPNFVSEDAPRRVGSWRLSD